MNRKIKTWDFSTQLLVRKRFIESFYKGNRYSSEMKALGKWSREYITKLGPTFVKLGQTLSTRTDLFPSEFISEIEYLQDSVEEIDQREISKIISTQFGNNFFEAFEYKPHKSASLGQVHRAKLRSGKKVAVKIQRPGIKELIKEDINTILQILDFLELIGASTGQSAKLVFFEAKEKLFDELDYSLEAKNAILFRNNFKDYPWIIVPRVYISKSTDKILIMEWVSGVKITESSKYFDPLVISKMFVESFIIQLTSFGYFHADPHPGNISISRNGGLIFYDFGLLIKLPDNIQQKSNELFTCIIQKDTSTLVDIFIDIGLIVPNGNKYEISLFFDSIINYLEKLDPSDPILKDELLKKLSISKPFIIPSSFIFLGKTISIIEGICTQLDPDFSFYEYLKPYFQENFSIDFSKMASSTLEMPSKIKYISETISQQRNEINLNLKSNNDLINNMQISTLSALTAETLLDQSSDFSIIFVFISLFFIFQNSRRRP